MRIRHFERALLCAILATGLVSAPASARASAFGARQAASSTANAADAPTRAFEVASVKQNQSGEPAYRATSNIPLGGGENYAPVGGLFSASNHFVIDYIAFAYKLNAYQKRILDAQLPKWAKDERFDIEARGSATATKDQMRLMMQSLLADRFKLAVHGETREGPIFAMVLVKPGQPGPNLQARSAQSEPCGAFTTSAAARSASGVPSACDVFLTLVDNGHSHLAARGVSPQMIADWLMGSFDRPIVDRTGLDGRYDITLEWTAESTAAPAAGAPGAQSEPGATYLQALSEQLGLKLDSASAPIETLTVDRIEEPSAN
jgi:uncharacterized protein (TIGR03435 family)